MLSYCILCSIYESKLFLHFVCLCFLCGLKSYFLPSMFHVYGLELIVFSYSNQKKGGGEHISVSHRSSARGFGIYNYSKLLDILV